MVAVTAGTPGRLTSSAGALRAADNIGMTDTKVISKSVLFVGFRGCSEDDVALYRVQGTDARGKVRVIEVCQGFLFKGATIRS